MTDESRPKTNEMAGALAGLVRAGFAARRAVVHRAAGLAGEALDTAAQIAAAVEEL